MEFRQLEAFVAVTKHQSFSKAADELYITQPTVSAHVKALEQELGVVLLDRTTKSLALTPEGQTLYSYARRLVKMRDIAVEKTIHNHRQRLTIAASSVPSLRILPSILGKYTKMYPHVDVVVTQSDSKASWEALKDGTCDIACIGSDYSSSGIEVAPIFIDKLMLITPCTPHYKKLKEEGVNLASLLAEPFIIREMGSGERKSASELISSLGLSLEDINVVIQTNDSGAITQFVAAGCGVSLMSYSQVKDQVEAGKILAFELPDAPDRVFNMAWSKRNHSEAVQSFVALAGECASLNLIG